MQKVKIIISCILLALAVIVPKTVSSQRIIWNVSEQRGKVVHFTFRSLEDISNGISKGTPATGFTELKVYFDTTGTFGTPVNGWLLQVYANTMTLESDFGSPDIPLNEVTLHYATIAGTVDLVSDPSWIPADNFELSTVPEVVSRGLYGQGDVGGSTRNILGTDYYLEWTVIISYDCGKTSGLVNYESDYYYTEVIFEIVEVY